MKLNELKNQCLACYSKRIVIFKSFNRLKSVSSDTIPLNFKIPDIIFCKSCKLIQKKTSKNYIKNIAKIYNNYKLYHQDKKGRGFSTFNSSGQNLSKSKVILDYFFKQKFHLPKNFKILDFGCHAGINMKLLKKYSINKNIFGYDKYKKNSTIFEKNLISKIYKDNIFQTKIKFDIIISFFVLEHILDTEEYFNKIERLLTNNGILFLQVPDIENNPYDFIIYDHVFHFSKSSLINLLKKKKF